MLKVEFQLLAGARGPIEFECPKCTDELIQAQIAKDYQQSDRENAQARVHVERERLEKRIGAAAIPHRFAGFSFDTFPAELGSPAATVCQRFRSYANTFASMRRRGVSALLLGATGTGKTGLACCVANKIMQEGFSAHFLTAHAAVRHMRDTWGRRGRTEREALDDLLAPDLLMLDEIGATVGSDSELAMVFEVINGRYAERKPTFLIANLPMEDFTDASGAKRQGLRSYLGQRVIDRFRDDGSFTIAFNWSSLRGAKR